MRQILCFNWLPKHVQNYRNTILKTIQSNKLFESVYKYLFEFIIIIIIILDQIAIYKYFQINNYYWHTSQKGPGL